MRRGGFVLAAGLIASAMPAIGIGTAQAQGTTMHHASGTFEVKLTPDGAADAPVNGMAIAKPLHGGIEGTSTGQMLSVGNPAAGGAGYVAMERITGTLDGKPGSFALQHNGTIDKSGQSLSVTVVPGSGTEALAGLTGAMTIRIEAGTHFYTFDYELAR